MGRASRGQTGFFGAGTKLKLTVWVMTLLTAQRFRAEAQTLPNALARGEPPGSDVFVMVREAVVRERPSKQSRFTGKLPGGSRVKLLGSSDDFLKIELPAGAAPGEKSKAAAGTATGYLSREVASIFAPDATAELVAAARALAGTEGHRRIAVAFLMCASERLRTGGTGDPAIEVLLGETAEALAASGGPFPPGLEITAVRVEGMAAVKPRYGGDAFRRAILLTAKTDSAEMARIRERAMAGALRQQYPEVSSDPAALPRETSAWIELTEKAAEPAVLRSAAGRAGDASLSLGGALLATGKLDELKNLEVRVRGAAARVEALLPDQPAGKKLLARAAILGAMRGNGTASFPQEARAKLGPKEVVARIDGKLGALAVTLETTVGGTHDGPRKKAARPVLPVPGSLRLSPDGKSLAWIEIAGPSKLVPVVASLDREEPAREIVPTAAGRAPANLLASLSGYSKDGQRLGLAVQAWNETPGSETRYSVVSVATGELLYETTKDTKSFQRLIQ